MSSSHSAERRHDSAGASTQPAVAIGDKSEGGEPTAPRNERLRRYPARPAIIEIATHAGRYYLLEPGNEKASGARFH
jgi:hypothetical protein